MKKSDKFIFGTIVGGAIGSVLGLLFAPKPGKETRQTVVEASKKAVTWGRKKGEEIKELHHEHEEDIDAAMEKLFDGTKKLRASFKSLKKHAMKRRPR